jgi:hypothetical protein
MEIFQYLHTNRMRNESRRSQVTHVMSEACFTLARTDLLKMKLSFDIYGMCKVSNYFDIKNAGLMILWVAMEILASRIKLRLIF